MLGPKFETATTEYEGFCVVDVTGEVDIKTAPEVEVSIASVSDRPLAIDLNRVDFIDSTGLRVLVTARARAAENGTRLVLCAAEDSAVIRTMRLAGLLGDFEVVPSKAELGTG